MDINQQKIQEAQMLEQSMNSLLMQRQAFNLELNETLNALEEVKKTDDEIYKLSGSIMLKADKEKVKKELEDKKKILELRLESIEKQEKLLEKKVIEFKEESSKEKKD
ncbi:TPA: prefoldin subunit beta [Candidatus Pacearchaeota archaeon]|jgi:prefoldin beta subunit|nr:prefoldin subunit beta [Candidatus Pacearchaeota archaeon]